MSADRPGGSLDVFVARQPITDVSKHVVAYELLFRPTADADASGTAATQATARVFSDLVTTFGFTPLTAGRTAFVNVPRDVLLAGLPDGLPAGQIVLELLESIEADDEVLDAIARARRSGFKIALDDFVLTRQTRALVVEAEYVKLDVIAGPDLEARCAEIRAVNPAAILLAEKVETADVFARAVRAGCQLFQGYFFGRPVTHGARALPPGLLGHVQLVAALQDPDLTIERLDRLVRHDAVLCLRILRTVNAAGFASARRVDSIRQAILLLGFDALRRWASLWVLAGLSHGAHPEVVVMSAVRARCCELLAGDTGGAPDAFLLGLLSLIDVVSGRPLEELVEELPVSAAIRDALLGRDTPGRRLLDCALACERGDWPACVRASTRAGLPPVRLAHAHAAALQWVASFDAAA